MNNNTAIFPAPLPGRCKNMLTFSITWMKNQDILLRERRCQRKTKMLDFTYARCPKLSTEIWETGEGSGEKKVGNWFHLVYWLSFFFFLLAFYVVLAGLELAVLRKLAFSLLQSSCVCLYKARITGMCQYTRNGDYFVLGVKIHGSRWVE